MVQSKDAKQRLGAVRVLVYTSKQAKQTSKCLVFDAVRVMVYTSKGLVWCGCQANKLSKQARVKVLGSMRVLYPSKCLVLGAKRISNVKVLGLVRW